VCVCVCARIGVGKEDGRAKETLPIGEAVCVSETETGLCAGGRLALRGVCVSVMRICGADMQRLSEEPRADNHHRGLLMLYKHTRWYALRTRDFITAGRAQL